MDHELHQLINNAKKGDEEALAALITRYKGQVFRHAAAMLGNHHDAEDVAQEAFIKMYRSLAKLESTFAFSAWLTQIVSRLCQDRLRKRIREHTVAEEAVSRQPDNSAFSNGQLKLAIEEAMRRLSPEHREAVILRDIQGYRYDEIAEILQIPLGTVKSRINSARLALREELKR